MLRECYGSIIELLKISGQFLVVNRHLKNILFSGSYFLLEDKEKQVDF